MSSRTYPHLADRLLNTPLLLHPQKLDAIIAGLGGRLLGVDGLQIDAAELTACAALPAEMFTTRRGERTERGYRVVDGVAVISAMGGLVHRTKLAADSSLLIGYNDLAADVEDALGKSDVHAIALVMDSPGGEVAGAFELAGLKTPFRKGGVVTAGNASGVNDGAAALIIASEQQARAQGLTPRARIVAMATAGVEPRFMGLGPVPAVRKVLERAGLNINDMDVIELNEAFAAQASGVLRQLGLADDAGHVNPNGGAIALGHPLGMSGARLALSASLELQRRNGRYALCTMCIGVGQGIAMILERV